MNTFITLLAGIMSIVPATTVVPNIAHFNTIGENKVTETVVVDNRAEKIDTYFAERGMPLEGYGEEFVKIADKYGLDWRLLPAISVRESSGGKHLLNNNPFGWGSCKIPFANFDEAIEVVGMNLSGNNPNTARYYSNPDNYAKLYAYNGTVLASYPDEVLAIMDMFEEIEITA
jgi:hypothetical protein